jgi:hypothetical protein
MWCVLLTWKSVSHAGGRCRLQRALELVAEVQLLQSRRKLLREKLGAAEADNQAREKQG